jgi:signal transduction histidine kinase
MRLSFRTKLLLSHVGLVAAVVAITMLQLGVSLGDDLVRQLESRLEQQARGAAQWVGPGRHPERLASRLGNVVHARVAIIDATGHLLADSEGEAEPSNLAELPEVAAARAGNAGHATRFVAALGDEVHYVAVPAESGLVVRLGAPLSEIHATQRATQRRLVVASIVGVLAALLLGSAAAGFAARPLRAMTTAASRIAKGDYDVVVAAPSPDDFGVLADALTSLAAELKSKIATLTAERDRIKRLEAHRREFVANASHELRTPVTAIRGFAETLLNDDPQPETRARFLGIIHRHAQRLGALLEGLLRLSELEARGHDEIERERVEIGPIVTHLAEAAQARAPSTTRIDAVIEGDPVALGDPLGVEQVIENLLENAVRYGKEGGRVELRCAVQDGRVDIRVRDDGAGIAPEHHARLFERFYRVDPSRSRERGGSGLGLAIVKHLVESMDGSVRVVSAPGEGATFIVVLPAA